MLFAATAPGAACMPIVSATTWTMTRRRRRWPARTARPRREPRQHLRGDLHGETGLAHAAGAGQGDERRLVERRRERDDLVLAPDERRELRRQVAGVRLQRPERRELDGQLRMHDLEDVLGSRQVAEAVLPEIEQLDPAAQRIPGEVLGDVRDTI